MSNTIYVVGGTSGDYSDRYEWRVKAFHTEQAAEAFRLACETFIRTSTKGVPKIERAALSPDPHHGAWDTEYFIEELELVDE